MTSPHPTVAEIAADVRAGRRSPREVVEEALARIAAVDPALGAFIDVEADAALAVADGIQPGPDKPLAGVPIAVKGSLPVAGWRVTHGSRFLEGVRADRDAFLVERLEDAGAVLVGTTRLPELAILPTTEPRSHGPARNPWDLERTPGGSSGGSAVAVAAGMVPAAHGTDGGGSIRTPAACTGLVGLKPSRGRISRGPQAGDSFLATDGFLTRTVEDTAILLDVAAGYEAGDATWAPRPAESYVAALRRPLAPLRIAVTAANPLGIEPEPVALDALRRTAEVLDALGHRVEEATPPYPPADALDTFLQVYVAQVGAGVEALIRMVGREPGPDELEPMTRELHRRALALTAPSHLAAMTELQAIARRMIGFFADHDVLMTPVLALRPLPIGALHGWGADPFTDFVRSATFNPYTPLYNVTGQPAIALPAGIAPDGLPTAVQLVGRPLGEDTLLRLAAQLELARPWSRDVPPDPSA